MKRLSIAAAVLVALTLTGCAGTPESAPSESTAPLVAESPAEVAGGDEAAYLDAVRAALPAATVIPDATDEQLLEAGREACERREAGEPGEDISVIEGEERNEVGIYLDSQAIVSVARQTLCPVD